MYVISLFASLINPFSLLATGPPPHPPGTPPTLTEIKPAGLSEIEMGWGWGPRPGERRVQISSSMNKQYRHIVIHIMCIHLYDQDYILICILLINDHDS